jgi:hypothetical protein
LIPFDVAQVSSLLGLIPSEAEVQQVMQACRQVNSSSCESIASCVGSVAALSMSHVCGLMQRVRKLVQAQVGCIQGVISRCEFLFYAEEAAGFCCALRECDLFSSVGVASLRAVVVERIMPRYEALKSAASSSESGVVLGAFEVPYRLLSCFRLHVAQMKSSPVEYLRIRASVVARSGKAEQPTLPVCDIFARNAILTTGKNGVCDAVIFGSQSLYPVPVAFLVYSEENTANITGPADIGNGMCQMPVMLYAAATGEDVLPRVISVVGAIFF